MPALLSVIIGWTADFFFGDPQRLPHPVVWFGRAIAFGEHRLNRGSHRKAKGAVMALLLIALVFVGTLLLRQLILHFIPERQQILHSIPEQSSPTRSLSLFTLHSPWLLVLFDAVIIFYCLAGTTLIREVRAVFMAVDRSLDEGRRQVARIVGRDTSDLSAQEVRTAALETLAENLSDGVIAPLFWLALLGTPGMLAYKMVNTLDSMIGYRTDRYRQFGCWAARIDDVANYVPARLTALLMILPCLIRFDRKGGRRCLTFHFSLFAFVHRYGSCHASPNSGYPEAALAGILDCRFGGPHYYFGQLFDKPYIGTNDRELRTDDMKTAVRVNRTAELLMLLMVLLRSIL